MVAAPEQMVAVGLGEIRTTRGGGPVLMALGLGSCVGIALYDPAAQVGGMAHVVLPGPPAVGVAPSPRFAGPAVTALVEQLTALGADRRRLVCKIAGGAQVLTAGAMRDSFRIGERNVEAVLAALGQIGLRPKAADCGGSTGRSFRLTIHDGRVAVKRLGQDWQEI